MFLLKIYLPNHVDLGFFITAIILLTLKKMKFVSLRLKVHCWVVKGYKLLYIIYIDLPPRFCCCWICDGPIEAYHHPHFNEIYQRCFNALSQDR